MQKISFPMVSLWAIMNKTNENGMCFELYADADTFTGGRGGTPYGYAAEGGARCRGGAVAQVQNGRKGSRRGAAAGQ